MPESFIGGVSLSVDSGSLHQMETMAGQLKILPMKALAATQVAVEETTRLLAATVEAEFQPHFRTGKTIQGMKVETRPLEGEITMGGGAPYIESGTRDHGPVVGKYMHWVENGEDVYAKWVKGVKKDPFVEHAIEHLALGVETTKLAETAFHGVISSTSSAVGVRT